MTIRELRLPKNSVVSLIVRDNEPFTPEPEQIVRTGDDLLIVTNGDDRRRVEARLRSISAGWPAGALARGGLSATSTDAFQGLARRTGSIAVAQ